MPKAVLEGLKKYPEIKISAVSAMLDSGGAAGQERRTYKTKVSFGDIRRAILVLSNAKPEIKENYAFRLPNGHVVANISFTATAIAPGGSPETAIESLRSDLEVPGEYETLPSTLNENDSDIVAELENGEIISGEGNIDVPKHDNNLKIKKVYLNRQAIAYPKTIQAIKNADLIVMGPGDLYSSLAQILLVDGISEAVNASSAKKVYVCNIMTKSGETNNFSVLEFTDEVEKYLKGKLGFVVYNKKTPPQKQLLDYKKEHPNLQDLVKIDDDLDENQKFIGADVLSQSGQIEHDPDKLANILLGLV